MDPTNSVQKKQRRAKKEGKGQGGWIQPIQCRRSNGGQRKRERVKEDGSNQFSAEEATEGKERGKLSRRMAIFKLIQEANCVED